MKKLKIFIIAVIIIGTFLAILYLSFIAEYMGKYTFSSNDGEKCFILYTSTSGKFSDKESFYSLLTFTQEALSSAGYDAVIIDGKENIEEELKDKMKKNKKYIFLDINSTKLLTSTNSIILRVGNKENPKYDQNIEYASLIKNSVNDLKINIISDAKSNYFQETAYKAARIEISENMNYETAKECISKILKPIIQ